MLHNKPLYAYCDDSIFKGKIIHERDAGQFEADFENFVNSRFAKGRIVLIDSKVEELNFKIPRHHENIFFCPLNECLRYLAGLTENFICLTLGTSVLFPRVNPERITAKEVYLAEIHACCFGIGGGRYNILFNRIFPDFALPN